MIDVPVEIKRLFTEDSIPKNFRVHFVNGEYRDLVNKDFVSESVIFTESAMSSDTFKFGLCESGSIEFGMYFDGNIKDLDIFCAIEIDISSLDSSAISNYGQTSSDVPYPFYRVPYGYFTVDSCDTQGRDGSKRVVAYNNKEDANSNSKVFSALDAASRFVAWGLNRDNQITEPKDLLFKWFDTPTMAQMSVINRLDNISQVSKTYDSSSPVFNYQKSYLSISDVSDSLLHNISNPTIEVQYRDIKNYAGRHTRFYIYVKGRYIYIPYYANYSSTTKPPIFSEYTRHNVEKQNTKCQKLTLPYRIGTHAFSEVSWVNTIDIESVIDQIYDSILTQYRETASEYAVEHYFNLSREDIKMMLSPSIKFMDISTWPCDENIDYTTDGSKAEPSFPSKCMTNGFVRSSDTHIISEYRLAHITANKRSDGRYVITVPHCGHYLSDRYTHREYTGKTDYFTCENYIAICIPTEVVVCADGTNDIRNVHPPYYDSGIARTVILANSFGSPMMKLYRSTERPFNEYIANNFDVEYDIRQCKDAVSNVDKEYVYDFNKNIIDSFYVYNDVNGGGLSEPSLAKTVLSSYAEFHGRFLLFDRTSPFKLKFAVPKPFDNILYPANNLYPSTDLYPSSCDAEINRSDWRRLSISKEKVKFSSLKLLFIYYIVVSNTDYEWSQKYSEITYLPVDREDNDKSGFIYDFSTNYISNHCSFPNSISLDSYILIEKGKPFIPHMPQDGTGFIRTVLDYLTYNKLNADIRALPYLEPIDGIHLYTQDSGVESYIFRHRISGIQSLIDNIESR